MDPAVLTESLADFFEDVMNGFGRHDLVSGRGWHGRSCFPECRFDRAVYRSFKGSSKRTGTLFVKKSNNAKTHQAAKAGKASLTTEPYPVPAK